MDTWDLSKMYVDRKNIEEDIDKFKDKLKKVDQLKDDVDKNFIDILDCLMDAFRIMDDLSSYAFMKKDEDSRVSANVKFSLETSSMYSQLSEAMAFVKPYLFSLSDEDQEELIGNNPKYKIYFERILRYKDHTLTEKEQRLMSKLSESFDNPRNDFYSLQNTDIKFPYLDSIEDRLTNANFVAYLTKLDRKRRKEVFEAYYDELSKYVSTFGSTLYGNIKNTSLQADIYKFDSSLEMELYDDRIGSDLYDNLIDTVHEYLPYLYSYYDLRKDLLGLDENHMYDVYTPAVEGYSKEIKFDEAKQIVLQALAPMGEEYLAVIKKAFDENWIDIYPREGKASGAYSGGSYDSYPYILLNYTDDLDSVFTLIHELGHSVHSYYSRANNDFIYSSYTLFVAEVASTTNELILLNYLVKNAKSDQEKIILLDKHINMFKSTVFRQAMFAEFERETHKVVDEGKALTGEDFSDIYYDLNKKYFGDSVVSDEKIRYEWARVPHFYRDFYVYKYATGFSAASILSEKILSGDKNALEAYINFLKDGSKNYPLDQLKAAGADIGDKDVLRSAFEVFKNKVLEFKDLVNKQDA
ncbi:MAG: oligoendopeptidase F [Finegoldia sp.]|nr:oligoendopeptidase F [Finegoldia sp.]